MSQERQPPTFDEVRAITAAARNSPLTNMRHAAALEGLCQKLEAYFEPEGKKAKGEPLPAGGDVDFQTGGKRKSRSKSKTGD